MRSLVWRKDEPFGAEYVDVEVAERRLVASGIAIGTAPTPYRLSFELVTAEGFVTTRLAVLAEGAEWTRALHLQRATDGTWSASAQAKGDLDRPPPGGDLAALTGAVDCDLGASPLTNSLPLLRTGLLEHGGSADLVMALVAVPELTVQPSAQRYTALGPSAVRFESGSFRADLLVNGDGFVVRYPGLADLVAA